MRVGEQMRIQVRWLYPFIKQPVIYSKAQIKQLIYLLFLNLGNIYTRIMNPTNAVLEERMATLDGGAAGLAVASGQTASAYSIQNLARAGR